MAALKVVFWQPTLSIHQAPMLRALANLGHDVHLVSDADVPPVRLLGGWERPNYGEVDVHLDPSNLARRKLESSLAKADLHVFSGLGAYPQIHRSMHEITTRGGTAVAYAEAPDPDGLAGALRSIRMRATAVSCRKRLRGLLAVGRIGTDYYARRGFPKDGIYLFGYFLEQPPKTTAVIHEGAAAVFVGSLTPRKRPIELAMAANMIKHLKIDYIGDGPLRTRLQDMVPPGSGSVLGTLPNQDTRRRMATASFLILPSRHDGWGAVVSESLLAGTPVLVGAGCGASEVVVSPSLGAVVSGADQLPKVLSAMISRLEAGVFDRPAIAGWARNALSGEAGADYLVRIIRHICDGGARPQPPWRVAKVPDNG